MSSDYRAITEHNEDQLGKDTASRKTQISMYSDSTHFIYEILQNADDYGASEVFFKLLEGRIEIEHNGEPFTEENVKAITYFGKSTSRDDLVKTGRFGVGFKSVFAFTATPIIISGDEHFEIYGLYRIKEYPYPDDFSRSRTRIILPFNHESKKPDYVEDLMPREDAYSKISDRLTKLNMNTLLFTRNIREIRWETDGRSGHYSREDDIDSNARQTTITDGKQANKYLVFSRVPKWEEEEHKAVEIAFSMDDKSQIAPTDEYLYVLFPTTQETRLKFILNGPYRTNPARETISEDDPFNKHLMKETCELMREVLPQIKERGLLTTQFLEVLPNKNDELKSVHTSLLRTIIKTFQEQELVPTDTNQYASATNVLQGPALIRKVITKEELRFLSDCDSVCWAKGVVRSSRADQFLRSLDIKDWGGAHLQKVLSNKFGPHDHLSHLGKEEVLLHMLFATKNDAWLTKVTDIWLQRLYILLADAIKRSEVSKETLKRCRIIRVRRDGDIDHVKGSQAYFPKGKSYKHLTHIKPSILKGKNEQETQKIRESLIDLGVSEVGEEERIDLLLGKFYQDGESAKITDEQHLKHVTDFIKWWKTENDASKFKDYAIFCVEGKDDLHKPTECFLDLPFEDTGLEALFGCSEIPLEKRKCPVSRKYKNVNGFVDFAKSVGIMHALEIRKYKATEMQKNVFPKIDKLRKTPTTIDRDYFLNRLKEGWYNEGSDYYIGILDLNMQKIELSLAVWKTLCRTEEEKLSAFYCPNDANRDKQKRAPSFLVNQLKSFKWVPDKDGCFRLPADITKESLHADFPYNNRNGWLDAIGFGENAKKQSEEYKKHEKYASSIGVPMELIDDLNGLSQNERRKIVKVLYKKITNLKAARKRNQSTQQENVHFHKALRESFVASGKAVVEDGVGYGGSVQNPSRRRDRTSESIAADIETEGKQGARSYFATVKKWKGKNDQVRVNLTEWYRGQCQICDKTFTQSNGEPYFEGLYLVSHTTAEWIDRVGNVLCLCPWHSAMFQFGPKEVDEDVIQQILRLKVQAEGGDGQLAIKLRLCGANVEIKFGESHLIDLQEMIKKSQESAAP